MLERGDRVPLERTRAAMAAYDAHDDTLEAAADDDGLFLLWRAQRHLLGRAVGTAFYEDTAAFNRRETCEAHMRPDRASDAGVWLRRQLALAPRPCCERDHDADGNCDRHSAPGVPRFHTGGYVPIDGPVCLPDPSETVMYRTPSGGQVPGAGLPRFVPVGQADAPVQVVRDPTAGTSPGDARYMQWERPDAPAECAHGYAPSVPCPYCTLDGMGRPRQ